jgi:6-phosphogluconolactonase (cycloisomerase 2 family)
MKRRDFLAGIAGATLGVARQPGPARTNPPAFMYVGSYTSEARGHGDGISVYRREAKGWTLVQVFKEFADPSFLALDRQGRCLYSAHGDGTQATAYRIDPTSGRLSVINQQPTGGRNGVHLAVDATSRFLVLANYASGTVVVFPINPDGSLGPVSHVEIMTGTPGPHRTQQESSHPHHCPFDPTGRFIVVPDKGLDAVFVYRLDTSNGKLVSAVPRAVSSRAGAAPRHVDFHPTRPFAYVINEIDSTITTCEFDPARGVLRPLQIVTTLPDSYTGNNSGAEIAVAPSGRFVYGSNRGHDSIVIFSIDNQTGRLGVVGWEPTEGRTPRYFGLDPPGTHLYAANQNSDTIFVFSVNQLTGKLMTTGEVVKVGSPSTIVFR